MLTKWYTEKVCTYEVLQWFDVLRNMIIFWLQKWKGVAAIFFFFEKSVSLNVIMFLNINIHALAKTFITETRSKKWLTCFTSTATSSPVIFIGWETLREMKMKGVTIILPHNNTVKSLHLHFYCLRLITVQATTSIDSFSLPQQISLIITSRKRNGEMWVRLCVIRGQINNQ